MKYKKLILLMTVILGIVSSIWIYGGSAFFSEVKGEARAVISFNFEGIDQGLDPHGSTFNSQQIKDEMLLEEALRELGITTLTPKQLGQHLQVEAYVPNDVLSRILPTARGTEVSQTQALGNQTYHPTQYVVTLERTGELGISSEEAIEIVSVVVANYQEAFVDMYKDTQAIQTAIKPIQAEQYDYAEYIKRVEGQLDILGEYLGAKEQLDRKFEHPETGVSFSDLLGQAELIGDVELTNVKALVDTFIITTNEEELRSIYSNRITNLERKREQLIKEKQTVEQALLDYEKDPTVILDNGEVVSEAYIHGAQGSLYDQLMRQSITLETAHNDTNYEIRYYTELLQKMENGELITNEVAVYTAEVEEMIGYISEHMDELLVLTIETADAYYEDLFKESVRMIEPVAYTSTFRLELISNTLLIGILSGFGLLLGVIASLGKELFGKESIAKVQTVKEAMIEECISEEVYEV